MSAKHHVEIAFGFTRNLHGFKRIVPQAKNFMDLELNSYADNFADILLELMYKADVIHFDISDMIELTGENGVLFGPKELNPPGSTNWELRTIWDNLAFRSKTKFYHYGQETSPEEILALPE